MAVDYSAAAVAQRLRQVDDLRRTCLALAARPQSMMAAREEAATYGLESDARRPPVRFNNGLNPAVASRGRGSTSG